MGKHKIAISPELIQQLKDFCKEHPRDKAVNKFGISLRTVYRYTGDVDQRKAVRNNKPIKETVEDGMFNWNSYKDFNLF